MPAASGRQLAPDSLALIPIYQGISSIEFYNSALAWSTKIDEMLLCNGNQIASPSVRAASTQLKDADEHLFEPSLGHL